MNILARERQQGAEDDALLADARHLHDEFIAAVRVGDMAAKALFAPLVRDWTAGHAAPKKHQTVGQALDSTVHDAEQDGLLALLCRLAYSAEPGPVLAQQARTMLDAMAWRFAAAHATGDMA